jgi:hypothetical protein
MMLCYAQLKNAAAYISSAKNPSWRSIPKRAAWKKILKLLSSEIILLF